MAWPLENGNRLHSGIARFFEDRDTLPGHHKDTVRQYFYDERRWVMEAMPNMPEHEWEMYIAWVKSVGDPLPRKGTWKKLKAP